ncbi:MAG TPA: RNA-binding protein [Thermoproteales archaeon]|nr:RNA-binding protein [Thermoproteales archaeon]
MGGVKGDLKVYSRYILDKKGKTFIKRILASWLPQLNMLSFEKVEVLKTSVGLNIFLVDNLALLWQKDGNYYPTLLLPLLYPVKISKVYVDEGAIPHLLNGADIMRPGIKRVEGSFDKNDIVIVIELKFSKPIVVGVAQFSLTELMSMKKGKVIRNIHHLNDKLWKLIIKYSHFRQ